MKKGNLNNAKDLYLKLFQSNHQLPKSTKIINLKSQEQKFHNNSIAMLKED